LSLPLLVQRRIVVAIITVIAALLTLALMNAMVPVKYFFPQVLLLFTLYGIFLLSCFTWILDIGKGIRDIMVNWWISYQSPKTFYDLARNAPKNIIAGLKVNLLRTIAGLILGILLFMIAVVTRFYPSVWGMGMFEVKASFPSEEEFQKASLKRFFLKPPSFNITVQEYKRSPLTSFCRFSFSWYISDDIPYRGIIQELTIKDEESQKVFHIATLRVNFPETTMLTRRLSDGVSVFRYSEGYFDFAYPGWSRSPAWMKEKLPIFDPLELEKGSLTPWEVFQKDKRKRWVLKDNALLCAEVDNTKEEDKFIYILGLFK